MLDRCTCVKSTTDKHRCSPTCAVYFYCWVRPSLPSHDNSELAYRCCRDPEWIRKTHRRTRPRPCRQTEVGLERSIYLRAFLSPGLGSLEICNVGASSHPNLTQTTESKYGLHQTSILLPYLPNTSIQATSSMGCVFRIDLHGRNDFCRHPPMVR